MKKVCIVGANGYIGSELLKNLKKNYKTIAVSRKKVNKKKIRTDIFKIIYSEEYQQPISVEYDVQCPDGNASRKGMNFYGVDSVITSNNADYKNNVWDKGHMVPAAAFNCDTETLKETFSYLNCALQHKGLNRGPWKELEAVERSLAEDFYVYVITV